MLTSLRLKKSNGDKERSKSRWLRIKPTKDDSGVKNKTMLNELVRLKSMVFCFEEYALCGFMALMAFIVS